MSWLDKLQSRWQLKSLAQVIIVLLVFACTGFTVLLLKSPIIDLITTGQEEPSTWFTVLYWILILPVYNTILLFYGFLFGQFSFFWAFEKKMWNRLTGRKADEA